MLPCDHIVPSTIEQYMMEHNDDLDGFLMAVSTMKH
jgi:hypothetical protein